MFGKIIPLTSDLPYNFTKYSMLFIFIFILITLIVNKKIIKIDTRIINLLFFNIFCFGILSIKGLIEGLFIESINFSSGLILSTLVIIFISQQKEFGRSKKYFDLISIGICIMLILQVIISALESSSGNLFGKYDIDIISTLDRRDFLSLFNFSQEKLFGFKFAFTGLIGQHNEFGIMLVFYNIFLMSHYERSRNKYLLPFFVLIIFALIGNGTRSALFTVFISDVIFFYVLKRKNIGFLGISLMLTSVVVIISPLLFNLIVRFYFQSPSLGPRILLWKQVLSQYLTPKSYLDLFLGLSIDNIRLIGVDILGHVASVESEYIRLYLYTGLLGLILYIAVFLSYFKKRSFPFPKDGIVSIRILVICIFFISLFMTGITYYAIYIIITLTILSHIHYNLILQKEQNSSDYAIRYYKT